MHRRGRRFSAYNTYKALDMINFTEIPYELNGHRILRIPRDQSALLSSRSQVMTTGALNDVPFKGPIEPDGAGGHWIDVTHIPEIVKASKIHVSIEQTNDWPEPTLPKEFVDMLTAHPKAKETYDKATPIAHWEWLRWTLATNNPETFKKHIEVSRSKLEKGMRRPCCFNRASCTTADVAKNGILIDPR